MVKLCRKQDANELNIRYDNSSKHLFQHHTLALICHFPTSFDVEDPLVTLNELSHIATIVNFIIIRAFHITHKTNGPLAISGCVD